jgi:broad specificity phosphatase PhoE
MCLHRGFQLTSVRDAPLTELGKKQSVELDELTRDNVQQTAQLLVSSPVSWPEHAGLIDA